MDVRIFNGVDLETNGFEKNSAMLKTAAKFWKQTIYVFIVPTRRIDEKAAKVTVLKLSKEKFFLHDI